MFLILFKKKKRKKEVKIILQHNIINYIKFFHLHHHCIRVIFDINIIITMKKMYTYIFIILFYLMILKVNLKFT
jgi:hypothetical protein